MLPQALAPVVDQHLPDFFAQQFTRGVLQQPLAFRVEVGKAALAIQRDKGFGDAGQRGCQAHGQTKRFVLGLLLHGNVLQYALQANNLAVRAAHRFAHGAHPFAQARGGVDLHFFIKCRAARAAALQKISQSVAVFGAEGGDQRALREWLVFWLRQNGRAFAGQHDLLARQGQRPAANVRNTLDQRAWRQGSTASSGLGWDGASRGAASMRLSASSAWAMRSHAKPSP